MEKIDIPISSEITLEANPKAFQEHVIFLRARIKILTDEANAYEDMMMSLVKANGGKISQDFGEFSGDVTLCKKNSYKFSDSIKKLEQEAKYLDTRIKAKKMVEVASGAEIEKTSEYLRYNIKIKGEADNG